LLDHNKLACLDLDANEAKEIVLDLAKAGEYGGYCLMRLLDCNKLDNLPVLETVAAKELVSFILSLARAEWSNDVWTSDGWSGISCLKLLLNTGKLENWKIFETDAARAFILDLAEAGEQGAKCLKLLLDNKLDSLPSLRDVAAKELVLELAKIEKGGVDCLRQLIQYDKLQNSKLKGINNPADVKAKSLKLLGKKPPNVKGLISLLDPQIQDS
jgi:hypothetical protein